MVLDSSDVPERPSQRTFPYNVASLPKIRPVHRNPGGVDIDRDKHHCQINIECGNLQPGRKAWSEMFFLGVVAREPMSLSGWLFAGNKSQPYECTLSVSARVARRSISVKELVTLAEAADEDD